MEGACPRCGSERIGHEHERVHGLEHARRERLICWDCGARFDQPAEVRREHDASPSPSELLSSRVRLALLIVALAGVALLAVLGLYALGFFDWVQCTVDKTASC